MISSDGIVVEVGDKDVKQNGSFCCVIAKNLLSKGYLDDSAPSHLCVFSFA